MYVRQKFLHKQRALGIVQGTFTADDIDEVLRAWQMIVNFKMLDRLTDLQRDTATRLARGGLIHGC